MRKGMPLGLLLIVTLLCGCKMNLVKEVSLAKVMNSDITVERATILVEVAACQDYKDSRKPSDSLVDAQKAIPEIIEGAEYKQCYRQKMESFAVFDIPVSVGTHGRGTVTTDFAVLGMNNALYVANSVSMVKKMEAFKKKTFTPTPDFFVFLKVTNDTGSNLEAFLPSAFLDDKPIINGRLSIGNAKDAPFLIQLSDVAAKMLLTKQNKEAYNYAVVLSDIKQKD